MAKTKSSAAKVAKKKVIKPAGKALALTGAKKKTIAKKSAARKPAAKKVAGKK